MEFLSLMSFPQRPNRDLGKLASLTGKSADASRYRRP
jgi:hypothetical protein